jgi:hypothetical protein
MIKYYSGCELFSEGFIQDGFLLRTNSNYLQVTSVYSSLSQGWANFFVGGPNEKSKMSGGPT